MTILEKRKGRREEFPVEDAAHYGRDTMVLECEIAVTTAATIRKLRNEAAPSQLASSFLFGQGSQPLEWCCLYAFKMGLSSSVLSVNGITFTEKCVSINSKSSEVGNED